jgi:hypothetical protein
MTDRTIITTGIIGGTLAAICCTIPVFVVAFGTLGLTAWLSKAEHLLIPALIVGLGLIGVGLYRRRVRQDRAHG